MQIHYDMNNIIQNTDTQTLPTGVRCGVFSEVLVWSMLCYKLTKFTNPIMHLFHIPQCNIQNRNVHIAVLNVALWDIAHGHCGICETGLLSCCVQY